MKKLVSTFLLAFLLLSCSKKEGKVDTDKIARIINEYSKHGYFSGVALITKGDKVIFELSNGLKNDTEDKINDESQFFIGSVTKQFTAALVLKALYEKFMQLYNNEEEAIREVKNALKNPLSVYLNSSHPIWSGSMPNWANKITLHHLLSNTSGLVNFTDEPGFEKVTNDLKFYQQEHSQAEVMNLIKDFDLYFEPGKGYNYSNTNYLLLGLIIESISSTPYDKFLEDRIFNFINMKNSKNPVDGNLGKLKNRSEYRELVDQFEYNPLDVNAAPERNKSYTNETVLQASRSIISTAKDLNKWNHALHKSYLILPKELHELMVKNHAMEFNNNLYGYGIIPTETNLGPVYTHTGGVDGFQSLVRYYKDDDISLIILSNLGPDMDVFTDKINEMENSLKPKVANPVTRKIIAESRIRALHPDKRSFITFLSEIDEATIQDVH